MLWRNMAMSTIRGEVRTDKPRIKWWKLLVNVLTVMPSSHLRIPDTLPPRLHTLFMFPLVQCCTWHSHKSGVVRGPSLCRTVAMAVIHDGIALPRQYTTMKWDNQKVDPLFTRSIWFVEAMVSCCLLSPSVHLLLRESWPSMTLLRSHSKQWLKTTVKVFPLFRSLCSCIRALCQH